MSKNDQYEYQDSALGTTEAAVVNAEAQPELDDGVLKKGRLAGLTMWQAIFVLSWPVLLESLLAALVGLVDTTLAAGDLRGRDRRDRRRLLLQLVHQPARDLARVGATALVSRSIGKNRVAVANAALGQCLLLVTCAG